MKSAKSKSTKKADQGINREGFEELLKQGDLDKIKAEFEEINKTTQRAWIQDRRHIAVATQLEKFDVLNWLWERTKDDVAKARSRASTHNFLLTTGVFLDAFEQGNTKVKTWFFTKASEYNELKSIKAPDIITEICTDACAKGKLEALKVILSTGYNTPEKQQLSLVENNSTYSYNAASYGHIHVLEWLREKMGTAYNFDWLRQHFSPDNASVHICLTDATANVRNWLWGLIDDELKGLILQKFALTFSQKIYILREPLTRKWFWQKFDPKTKWKVMLDIFDTCAGSINSFQGLPGAIAKLDVLMSDIFSFLSEKKSHEVIDYIDKSAVVLQAFKEHIKSSAFKQKVNLAILELENLNALIRMGVKQKELYYVYNLVLTVNTYPPKNYTLETCSAHIEEHASYFSKDLKMQLSTMMSRGGFNYIKQEAVQQKVIEALLDTHIVARDLVNIINSYVGGGALPQIDALPNQPSSSSSSSPSSTSNPLPLQIEPPAPMEDDEMLEAAKRESLETMKHSSKKEEEREEEEREEEQQIVSSSSASPPLNNARFLNMLSAMSNAAKQIASAQTSLRSSSSNQDKLEDRLTNIFRASVKTLPTHIIANMLAELDSTSSAPKTVIVESLGPKINGDTAPGKRKRGEEETSEIEASSLNGAIGKKSKSEQPAAELRSTSLSSLSSSSKAEVTHTALYRLTTSKKSTSSCLWTFHSPTIS
jgi:hypothetical protein